MRGIKQIFYLIYEIIVVYYIYSISVLLLRVGFKDISRDIYFVFIVLFLIFPLLKCYKTNRRFKLTKIQDQKKINSSIKGLEHIEKLDSPKFKVESSVQDLDSVIITSKGVFNIVKCHYSGTIIVDSDSSWSKKFRGKNNPVKSPIDKLKLSRRVLAMAFDEDIIYDVIIMMEDRVKVIGDKNMNFDIISYSELLSYINEYNAEEKYNSTQLYDKLYPYIYSNEDVSKDISIYNKYMDNLWKYRGRLGIVLISFVFYISNTIRSM